MQISKIQLLNEPPGHRRVHLAIWRKGMNYSDIAGLCNCDRSVVSRVVHGANITELHTRIRLKIAQISRMPEDWLFADPEPKDVNIPEAKAS